MRWLLPMLAGITLLLPTAANADELHLKDGSVVTGTVVGYEQDSFRVKTSWGYAEIRRDQVAQIVIGGGAVDDSTSTTSAAQKSAAKKKSTATPPQISPSVPPPPVQSLPVGGASQPLKGQLLVRAVVTSPSASPVATENSAAARLVAAAPGRPAADAKSLPASAVTTAPPTDKLLVNSGSVIDDSGSNPPTRAAAKPHNDSTGKPASGAARAAAVAPVGSGTSAPGKAARPKVSEYVPDGTAPPTATPASVVKPAKLASPSPPAQSGAAATGHADGAPSPAPPPKPTKAPPAPEPVHEAVAGNAYTNETYGIHMFRPPDWQLNADARKLMPGAIAALGTADEKTYFFIGLEPAHGVLAENLAEADKRLRGIMENYHAIGDRQVTISGAPATERRFRGTVDGRDWTGIVAILPRANQLFTVFGITTADSEISGQIQENVIRRAIDSLAFTAVSTNH